MSSFYCRGAHVAILAVDLTKKKTFEKLQQVFIPLLEQQAPTCMTVVVGTKLDLIKSQGRQIGASEGKSFAVLQHNKQLEKALEQNPSSFLSKVQGNESYFETSSKTGEGVTELFQYIERIILVQLQKTQPSSTNTQSSKTRTASKSGKPEKTIRLDDPPPPSSQESGCCKN